MQRRNSLWTIALQGRRREKRVYDSRRAPGIEFWRGTVIGAEEPMILIVLVDAISE
jgi:hypothetical protein